MKFFKSCLSLALVLTIGCIISTQSAAAQTQEKESTTEDLINAVGDYFSGESKENIYYNMRKEKISVTIRDLSITDRLSYSSIHSAFSGTENLEVEGIAFAPDFKEGKFFLSFSTESEEPTNIVILDVRGNEIHNETIEDFSGTYESAVNIEAEQKGTYFLKVIQGFSLLNKKLVIE